MNPPPPQPGFPPINRAQSEELKQYLLNKQGEGPLLTFLYYSASILLILLVSVLKPHSLYKKFLIFIMEIRVTIGGYKYKIHHFLLLFAAFYGTLYFFIQMQGSQTYPSKLDPYKVRMAKLDKKWVLDSQSWLSFLCIICLLSIYKNSKLFSSENYFKRKIKELDEELKNKK